MHRILLLLLLVTSTAFADLNGDLGKFFDGLGYSSNITEPHAYQGQQAGFYSGGSIFARNAVRNVQLAQIEFPSYRAGCGGIDLFMGGFSFINTDKLVAMMKNVLNNSMGYAFNLALETVTPQIANVMRNMQSIADKINQTNINSCENAAAIVGSLWPKTAVAQQHVCADIGTSSSLNLFADYAAARQGCGAGGQRTETFSKAKDAYKDMVFENVNLAWKAIQQNEFARSDPQVAGLLMALSGSVIIIKQGNDDAKPRFISLPSLIDNQDLLHGLLNGGLVPIYRCNTITDKDCLEPKPDKIRVSIDKSLRGQIAAMLNDMVSNIYTDQPLTKTQIGLLEATSIPVYKILNVQSAFAGYNASGGKMGGVDVAGYADVIATDLLFQYLTENLNIVKYGSATLQYPSEVLKQFEDGINNAMRIIRTTQQSAYSQLAATIQIIEQTQTIERMLAGQLSTQLSNSLEWARGIKG